MVRPLQVTDFLKESWKSAMTVREYIVQLLMSRSLQLASADALQDMVTELRNEARINILYKGTGN